MKFFLLSAAIGAPLAIRSELIIPILTDDELSQFGTGQTLPPTIVPIRPVVPTQAPITPFPTEGTEPPATETPTVSSTVIVDTKPPTMSMSYAMSVDYHYSQGDMGSMDYEAIVPCMTFGKSGKGGKACGKTGKGSKVGKTGSKDDGQTGYYGDEWYGKSEDGGYDLDDVGYKTDDAYGSGGGDGGGDGGEKSDDGYVEHDADKTDDGYADGGDGGDGGAKTDDGYSYGGDGGSGGDKLDDELSMSYDSHSVDGNGGGKSDDGYNTDDHYNSPKPKADKPMAKTTKDSESKSGKSSHGKSGKFGKSGGGKSGKGAKPSHSHDKPHKPSKTSKPQSSYPDHGYSDDYYSAYNAEEVRRLRGKVARVVQEMGFDVVSANNLEDRGGRGAVPQQHAGRRQRKLSHKSDKTDSPTFFPTASPTLGKSHKHKPDKYDTNVPTLSPTLETIIYLDDYTLVDDYEIASMSMSFSYDDENSEDDAIIYLDDDALVEDDDGSDDGGEDDDEGDDDNGVDNGGINVDVDHDGDGDVTVNVIVNSGSGWSETHSTMAPLDDDYEEDTTTSTPSATNDDYSDDVVSTVYPTDVPEGDDYAVTSTVPVATEYAGDDAIVYLDDYAATTTAVPATTEYGANSTTTAPTDDGYETPESDNGSDTYEDDYTAPTYDDEYEQYDDAKTEDYRIRRRVEANRMTRSGFRIVKKKN